MKDVEDRLLSSHPHNVVVTEIEGNPFTKGCSREEIADAIWCNGNMRPTETIPDAQSA
jgi:hypothetical protein